MIPSDEQETIDTLGEIDDTFAEALNFENIVDPTNWQPPGEYYQTMPVTTRAAVNKVVKSDEQLRRELRDEYFPKLLHAGTLKVWERANPRYIETIQRKKLYSGQVVAADGTIAKYETIPIPFSLFTPVGFR